MDERTYVYSNWLDFPVVLKEPFEQRVYVEWRGLPLQSPPTLVPIKSERYVAVLKAWRENSCALIKLRHPDLDHVSVDYIVNWIMRTQDRRTIVLLQLPQGFPGEGLSKLILTYFVGEKIFTMKDEDFNERLEILQQDVSNRRGKLEIDPEELFGRMPNANSLEAQVSQAALLRLIAQEEGRKQCCIKCEKEIDEKDNFCASCGAKRSAPECPKCGQPVTAAKDARVRYHDENGYYPWHFGWDGRCINCDVDFASRFEVETGHNLFFSPHAHEIIEEAKVNPDKFKSSEEAYAGKTTIDISMDQSIFMAYDAWDYQPTIAVSLKRWQPANHDGDGALKKHETFVLTPTEWRAIADQLNGPLKILLERRPWTRDTT